MTICKLPEMTAAALPDRPLSVALGNFDGVHLGHRRLLETARENAAAIPDCASAVWTFARLAKENPEIPALTTAEEKIRLFAGVGLGYAILEDFSAVRDLTPEAFAEEYLIGRLRCASVICGFNFRFGRGGCGDADGLRETLARHGVPLTVVPPVLSGGRIVSSTAIRAAIADGDMETAQALLGHPFSICFPVLYGKQLGRTIGLPTINQDFPEGHIIPRRGIYACRCVIGEKIYEAVSNVGVRPSVESDGHVNCETHIIGYDGFLYGQRIRVEFFRRLRGEMKFPSVDALKTAIEGDIAAARAYFAAQRRGGTA